MIINIISYINSSILCFI